MVLNLQSLETISFVDKLSKTFACETSEDGRISLITENNIHVYTLLNHMNYEFDDLAFSKDVIEFPKFSLRDEFRTVFFDLPNTLREVDVHQLMSELDLNNCFDDPLEITPLLLKWSPKGLYRKSFCLIAVLNNMYGLSILAEHRDISGCLSYYPVANVTKYLVEQASKEWDAVSAFIGQLTIDEWKQQALHLCPIAIEWSHLINDSSGTYAILFVAHRRGNITCWRLNNITENSLKPEPVHYMGMHVISFSKNVSTLHWKKLGGSCGALFLGNDEGIFSMVGISNLNTDTLQFEEQLICDISEGQNNKKVLRISSIDYQRYSFIIIVLQEELKILLVQDDGTILDEDTYRTENKSISALCHYSQNILLLLTSDKLRKLTLNIKGNKIRIEDELVQMDFDATRYTTCGMVLSKNRVFVGILAYPCLLKDISKHHAPYKFYFYHDSSISPFDMVLQNTDKGLTDYWDCFEVLRILSIKEQKFPWKKVPDLDYDSLTLSQLKSLRWISKLSEKLYNMVPTLSEYKLKSSPLLHCLTTIQVVVERMRRLLDVIAAGKKLSTFQMRSLDISNMYLKEMVLKKILEKCEVGERFVDDITEVMEFANELEYPDMPQCYWCKEKIIGPTCIPPHSDSRCCISMMQIYLTPGFICPYCSCEAHLEIAKECKVVMCPYCDVPMYEKYSQEEVREALKNTDEEIKNEVEPSLVEDAPEIFNSDDCGSIDYLENDIECLVVSDSEEELNENENIRDVSNEYLEKSEQCDITQKEALDLGFVINDGCDGEILISDETEVDSDDVDEI